MVRQPRILIRTDSCSSPRYLWAAWIAIAVVFFFATHAPMISLTISDYWRSEKLLWVEEGNLRRQVAFIALGVLGVLGLLGRARFRLGGNRPLACLAVSYLLWACLSLIWATDLEFSSRRILLLAIMYVSAAATARRFSLPQIASGVFLVTALFLAAGVTAELALGTFSPLGGDYRFSGTQHPNQQGVNCALFVLSGIAVFKDSRGIRKGGRLLVLLGFVFLFLTRSRTSFAATIFCASFFWTVVTPVHRKWVTLVVILIAMISATLIMGDIAVERGRSAVFMGRFFDEEADTLAGRFPLWDELLTYAKVRPLAGYGYGSFWTPDRVNDISDSQGWDIFMSHSIFLETLVHLGIIGLTILIGMFARALLSARRTFRITRDNSIAFAMSVILFGLIDGITETFVIEPNFLMFVVAVLIGRLIFNREWGDSENQGSIVRVES